MKMFLLGAATLSLLSGCSLAPAGSAGASITPTPGPAISDFRMSPAVSSRTCRPSGCVVIFTVETHVRRGAPLGADVWLVTFEVRGSKAGTVTDFVKVHGSSVTEREIAVDTASKASVLTIVVTQVSKL